MPKLKELRIKWPFRMESFGLEYYVSEEEDARAVLEISGAPPSEPSPEIMEAWRQVAEIILEILCSWTSSLEIPLRNFSYKSMDLWIDAEHALLSLLCRNQRPRKDIKTIS